MSAFNDPDTQEHSCYHGVNRTSSHPDVLHEEYSCKISFDTFASPTSVTVNEIGSPVQTPRLQYLLEEVQSSELGTMQMSVVSLKAKPAESSKFEVGPPGKGTEVFPFGSRIVQCVRAGLGEMDVSSTAK